MDRLELRDRKKYNEQLLVNMQEAEITHANYIGKALKIPVQILSAAAPDELARLLRDKP